MLASDYNKIIAFIIASDLRICILSFWGQQKYRFDILLAKNICLNELALY
jgi:hypothetical protein